MNIELILVGVYLVLALSILISNFIPSKNTRHQKPYDR